MLHPWRYLSKSRHLLQDVTEQHPARAVRLDVIIFILNDPELLEPMNETVTTYANN